VKFALLVLFATWLSVFTLGLQSLNVNGRHYWAAGVTSLGIGAGHILLYRYMPGADWLSIGAYLVGGVTGITSSIWFHARAKAWLSLQYARWLARRAVSRQPVDEHQDVANCGGFCRHHTDRH
jgi:hypothetical protein